MDGRPDPHHDTTVQLVYGAIPVQFRDNQISPIGMK